MSYRLKIIDYHLIQTVFIIKFVRFLLVFIMINLCGSLLFLLFASNCFLKLLFFSSHLFSPLFSLLNSKNNMKLSTAFFTYIHLPIHSIHPFCHFSDSIDSLPYYFCFFCQFPIFLNTSDGFRSLIRELI